MGSIGDVISNRWVARLPARLLLDGIFVASAIGYKQEK